MSDTSAGNVVTRPTIAVALEQFLTAQEQRLAPRTIAQYRDVVVLLQHFLNDYAYASLDEHDARRYEQLRGAVQATPQEFCQIFGPDHMLPHLGEFLGYFMIRKVVASRTLGSKDSLRKRRPPSPGAAPV